MNYPLIEKWLGIEVYNLHAYEGFFFVSADKLEAKLAEGFEVYGDESTSFSNYQLGNTYALAIGKQPIKKKTKEQAALEFVEKISKDVLPYAIIKEAKEILEME